MDSYVILFIFMIFFFGIILLITEIVRVYSGLTYQQPKVIYRYIPRTFEEEQTDPLFASDIFETMFSQPSTWVNSILTYDKRKQEKVNQYFINQL